MRSAVLIAFLSGLAGVVGAAGVETFPAAGWEGATVRRQDDGNLRVMAADGRTTLLYLTAEPNGSRVIERVAVTNRGDRLEIYTAEAFKAGMLKLVTHAPRLRSVPAKGSEYTVRTVASGHGEELTTYLMGDKGYFHRRFKVTPNARPYDLLTGSVGEWNEAHVRFDIRKAGRVGPLSLYRFEVAPIGELAPNMRPDYGVPELLFHAPFDDGPVAAVARGTAAPRRAEGLEFVPGLIGGAVRISRAAKSRLEYGLKGNAVPERGTVMMWLKREWKDDGKREWREFFAFRPDPPWERDIGSGRVRLWWHNDGLRGEMRDLDDTYQTWPRPFDPAAGEEWFHVALTWDEYELALYQDGRRRNATIGDGYSALKAALTSADPHPFVRLAFDAFAVGGGRGEYDGLIDDLRIYSAPMKPEEIARIYAEHGRSPPPMPDYAARFGDGSNAYLAPSGKTPGVPEGLELVEEVTLDEPTVAKLTAAGRFASVGGLSYRTLAGRPYLESDGRFAVRFTADLSTPLNCFEIDYPDDAKRTMDYIVQDAKNPSNDYTLQVGVMTGGEYPLSSEIRTHRCLYWPRARDVAFVSMHAKFREGTSAVATIRHYRVKGGALPAAAVREPPAVDGERRFAALYFEDPAIRSGFGMPSAAQADIGTFGDQIDRVAAYMKYLGLNLLCYPGAWYQGLIGDDYNPRGHTRDFLSGYYEKFDREGLFVMPTVHLHNFRLPEVAVTRAGMSDGSLHSTPYAIFADGRPNWGGWHGTPPNFNFAHPRTREEVRRLVMTLVEQGWRHPSFKGVVLHMTRHDSLWFGSLDCGYNDYAVEAFSKATGVKVPADRKDPRRGKAYADWILANARERWIAWRCELVADFYAELAAAMRAKRADLKLVFNPHFALPYEAVDPKAEDFALAAFREAGYDPALICGKIPNAVACRTIVPADCRKQDAGKSAAALAYEWERDGLAGFYPVWKGAGFPMLNHHDRYWENAIGREGGGASSLKRDWLEETGWRVSTINPGGRNALRHFALPLKVSDVLAVSKGGFLIGTYGMEDVLAPFLAEFRALPAVKFVDIPTGDDDLVYRGRKVDGVRYFYLLNATDAPKTAKVRMPRNVRRIVTGERMTGAEGAEVEVRLDAWELRAFCDREP